MCTWLMLNYTLKVVVSGNDTCVEKVMNKFLEVENRGTGCGGNAYARVTFKNHQPLWLTHQSIHYVSPPGVDFGKRKNMKKKRKRMSELKIILQSVP